MAYAAQRFGLYVVDCSGNDPNWHSNSIGMDYDAVPALIKQGIDPRRYHAPDSPWQSDILKMLKTLQVVENNGPRPIGGGGEPLYPLAPDFTDGNARCSRPLQRILCDFGHRQGHHGDLSCRHF